MKMWHSSASLAHRSRACVCRRVDIFATQSSWRRYFGCFVDRNVSVAAWLWQMQVLYTAATIWASIDRTLELNLNLLGDSQSTNQPSSHHSDMRTALRLMLTQSWSQVQRTGYSRRFPLVPCPVRLPHPHIFPITTTWDCRRCSSSMFAVNKENKRGYITHPGSVYKFISFTTQPQMGAWKCSVK